MKPLDPRYVLARFNYTCQNCKADVTLENAEFYNFGHERKERLCSVIPLCQECDDGYRIPDESVLPKHSYRGRLTVVTGPMFASKSTVTRSIYNKYQVFNSRCIWVKPTTDDRTAGFTETHNKEKFEAVTIDADRPDKYIEMLGLYDVIAIDEAQFFSDRLLYVIHTLLRAGKLIIANGLRLTAKRDLFGIMHYLMVEADDIISLKAVCSKCKAIDSASRTKSYEELPSVQTGGAEAYYAVCPMCDGVNNENSKS